MSGHTPGHWERDGIAISGRTGDICYLGELAQCPGDIPRMLPNAEANARLIAAAPDLLAALKGVLAITDRDHVAWEKARAAIAKAEGLP